MSSDHLVWRVENERNLGDRFDRATLTPELWSGPLNHRQLPSRVVALRASTLPNLAGTIYEAALSVTQIVFPTACFWLRHP
jgi:hypothetical protein